jgi:GNAT superfamily N-acetyltransferase
MEITIRPARRDDIDRLVEIGLDAHETLRLEGAVPDEPPSDDDEDEFLQWLAEGTLVVAVDASDTPLGYGGALPTSNCLHICELDVARAWQRRGIGRSLMLALIAEARKQGLKAITLTTDRIVPFNARFYETLGFRVLDADELTILLRDILADEAARGLDAARRCAMLLSL